MDEPRDMDMPGHGGNDETTPTEVTAAEDAAVEETSSSYLHSWNVLVSTTNWEKGRIIAQWREALREVGAPTASYSDEAWSRRVGNVTPQHVGRLRRVHDRFGAVHDQYEGLYWSHFQAALDWDDAEMWLEGGVQSGWSVAAMRQQRWETLGGDEDQKPRDEDIVVAELDEDVEVAEQLSHETISDSSSPVRSPSDAADAADAPGEPLDPAYLDQPDAGPEAAAEPMRPFEDLGELPDDMNEAFEAMKLSILHHKLSGWQEIACGRVLDALDALKHFATAPTDG
jgi:hypothetical protein